MAESIGALRAELGLAVAQFEKDMGKAVGTVRRGSANMERSFKKARTGSALLGKSMARMRGAALQMVTGLAAIAALRSAARTMIEFNDAIADLSAITGAVGKDLEFLADKSRKMGRDLGKGAAETAEAFKLIASAKPDLLENVEALAKVTKAATILAVAAGITLPEAATALGNALNQFNAGADKAVRFMNTLAAGAKFGSSEIPDVTMALRDAGTVAKDAGISFEELNALIQILAANGIKAAKAGVGLRNMIIRLQTGAKETNPELIGMSAALHALGKEQLSATEMMRRFGMEGIVVAGIISRNAEKFDTLVEKLTGTETAADQARIKMDTLGGDLKVLSASYENLELAILGASDSMTRDFIQALIQVTNAIANLFGDPGNSAGELRERIMALSMEIKELEQTMAQTAGTGSKLGDALATTGANKLETLRAKLISLKELLAAVERQSVAAASAAADAAGEKEANAELKRFAAIKKVTAALKKEGDQISRQIGKLSVSNAEWTRLTALRSALLTLQKAGITLTDEELSQLVAQAGKVKDLATQYDTLVEKKKKTEEASKKLQRTVDDLGLTFASAFEDAILRLDDLGSILNSLVDDLFRIMIRRTVTEPLFEIFGDLLGGVAGSLFGFRQGGTFKVGGTGGADSQVVAFKASPNETVSVGKPGAQAEVTPMMVRSEVNVNVFAPPGSDVKTEESHDQSGRRLDIIIDEAVSKNIAPGTKTFKALQSAFAGMNPALVGR